eukprot:gene19928-23844_t
MGVTWVAWPHGASDLLQLVQQVQLVRSQSVPHNVQETTALTGLVFQSSGELDKVPSTSEASLCRDRYSPACEAALNDQINVEYNVSYIYHSMYAYFGRDNVALPGIAKYFKEASDEERGHAEKLMEYQNHRGGKVVLQTLTPSTITEFEHADKGDALYAMEIALALEKLNNEKLLSLHQKDSSDPDWVFLQVAVDNDDPQMTDFIEGEFLEDQMKAIYEVSHMVSELRRIGKGHVVVDFQWAICATYLHQTHFHCLLSLLYFAKLKMQDSFISQY